MIIKPVEIEGCQHQSQGKLYNHICVVVDLEFRNLIGKQLNGDNLFCHESTNEGVVPLTSQQSGTVHSIDIEMANVTVRCNNITCRHHQRHSR